MIGNVLCCLFPLQSSSLKQQRPRKPHEEEKLKREESVKKKDSEEKGKQEMQDKLSRLFLQQQEPAKPAVQAPWSTAGMRGQNYSSK